MSQDNTTTPARVWYHSAHASLCVLGSYLRRSGFFTPLEEQVQIQQKTLKYTPVQKLEMFLVALWAGAKAVSHTDPTVGVDPALCTAFGLPGCADQSVIAATLNAATPTDVAALQAALAETFRRFSRARRHDVAQELLVLDVDLSPLPASPTGCATRLLKSYPLTWWTKVIQSWTWHARSGDRNSREGEKQPERE